MKKLIVTGNVGADLVSRVSPSSGKEFLTFSVAHYEGKDSSGAERKATWVNVVVPKENYIAKYVENGVKKGSKVIVRGRNRIQTYLNKEGKAAYNETLWLDEIEIINTDTPVNKSTSESENEHTGIEQEIEEDFNY